MSTNRKGDTEDFEKTELSSLGRFIKHERETRNMTLATLSEMTGISASYINRIERGDRKAPSIKIIERLANALDVSTSSFLESSYEGKQGKVYTLSELFYANSIKLSAKGDAMSAEEKAKLIEMIEFIGKMEWGSSKHQDLARLLELIDEFQELKQK